MNYSLVLFTIGWMVGCSKGGNDGGGTTPPPAADTSLTNTTHLANLMTSITFDNGDKAYGVYIYSNAPYYTPAEAPGEGYTCVDDVARAALYYIRSSKFSTDADIQARAMGLIRFVINMQAPNGYFYNFLQTGNTINKYGQTSINLPKWWSWRALQALSEGAGVIRAKDATLASRMDAATNKLITAIKTDLVNLPQTTTFVDGIEVPQWLPEGADQAATLILGLIPYCRSTDDATMKAYIKKLADGILVMQSGGTGQFPYGAFLSSGTSWHAYGNEQSHALFQAGAYLNDNNYINKAKIEVDNFYNWQLNSGYLSSFQVKIANSLLTGYNQQTYEQIAYGIRPMVSAAIDAYVSTGDVQYANMAGRLAAWFIGTNSAGTAMYSFSTGLCFDAIAPGNSVNQNSGAESTIEALLAMQQITDHPVIKTALLKYKK